MGAKRELEIISGFARPYKIEFAPSFWDSCRANFGMGEEELEGFRAELLAKVGGEETGLMLH